MQADERAIRDLLHHWHRATAAGDVEAVLALMAEDVVFLVAGHPPMKGRDAFASGLRALLASHEITSKGDIQEVAISGELAYCWSVLDVRTTPKAGGQPSVRSGNVLSVFRKQADGGWVLSRDANLLTATD